MQIASILTLEPIPRKQVSFQIHDSDCVVPQRTTGHYLASVTVGEGPVNGPDSVMDSVVGDQDLMPATVKVRNQTMLYFPTSPV